MTHTSIIWYHIPVMFSSAVADDGLLFDTVQLYVPSSVAFRECIYLENLSLSNTVTPPSSSNESLVQVTVVTGPPVEIQ